MNSFTFVVSRSISEDTRRKELDRSVATALAEADLPVIDVGHLYYLPDTHPLWGRLARDRGRLVVFASLYPRSIEWVVRTRIGAAVGTERALEGDMICVDLRTVSTGRECVERVLAALELGSDRPDDGSAGPVDLWEPAPPRWYPVLDLSRCVNCKQCSEFCLFGVYGMSEEGKVTVEHPDACKDGCPACARVCPQKAILFPECVVEPWIAGAEEGEGACSSPDAGQEDLDALIDELESRDL